MSNQIFRTLVHRVSSRFALAVTLFVCLSGVALGIGFAVMGWASYQKHREIAEGGAHAQGVVLEKRVFEVEDTEDGGKTVHHQIRYEFKASGEPVQQSWDIRESTWQALQVGSTLPIVYLPRDPWGNNFPEGESTFAAGGVAMAVGFGVLGVAFAGLWLYLVYLLYTSKIKGKSTV